MTNQQQLQQCIKDCQNAMHDLKSMANKSHDIKLRSTLDESAHHLDMAVKECEYALKQVP